MKVIYLVTDENCSPNYMRTYETIDGAVKRLEHCRERYSAEEWSSFEEFLIEDRFNVYKFEVDEDSTPVLVSTGELINTHNNVNDRTCDYCARRDTEYEGDCLKFIDTENAWGWTPIAKENTCENWKYGRRKSREKLTSREYLREV